MVFKETHGLSRELSGKALWILPAKIPLKGYFEGEACEITNVCCWIPCPTLVVFLSWFCWRAIVSWFNRWLFWSSSSLCNFESNKHVHLLFSICLLQVEALICLILSGCECSNDLKCFEMAVTGNYISVQCEKWNTIELLGAESKSNWCTSWSSYWIILVDHLRSMQFVGVIFVSGVAFLVWQHASPSHNLFISPFNCMNRYVLHMFTISCGPLLIGGWSCSILIHYHVARKLLQ